MNFNEQKTKLSLLKSICYRSLVNLFEHQVGGHPLRQNAGCLIAIHRIASSGLFLWWLGFFANGPRRKVRVSFRAPRVLVPQHRADSVQIHPRIDHLRSAGVPQVVKVQVVVSKRAQPLGSTPA